MRADAAPYGAIRDGAVGIAATRIAWVGARARPAARRAAARDAARAAARWVTPGLVDCHTHLVYAGNRARRVRARGCTARRYADIAREGGGIDATVRATRAASDDELARAEPAAAGGARGRRRDDGRDQVRLRARHGERAEAAARRARRSAAERRRRRAHDAARRARGAAGVRGPRRRLHRLVCRDTIPAVARAGLADAVDAFCETIGFTPAQTRRVFAAARAHGLPVKLHADQLSDTGRRRARRRVRRAVGRSSRIHERGGRRGDGARRAPSRCCCPARSTRCARRGCRRSRRCARTACRWRSRPTAIPARRRRPRCC